MMTKTGGNELPKRWRGDYFYGYKLSKTKKILKTTTHNKLYKIAKWNYVRHCEYRYYCYICGNNENIRRKSKRNRGQKPKTKNKPWRRK